ncbi:MAG TPA: hypothetical protein VGW12_16535 [Pyrinomonadaceae bacterium]|nr:hypothetical protein [Pyrinomonadaceae bacterium]
MSANIRIIKRTEREAAHHKATESRTDETKNTRQATRDIAGHVNTWIKEFRKQRHTSDPRRAFANLFVNPATSTAD